MKNQAGKPSALTTTTMHPTCLINNSYQVAKSGKSGQHRTQTKTHNVPINNVHFCLSKGKGETSAAKVQNKHSETSSSLRLKYDHTKRKERKGKKPILSERMKHTTKSWQRHRMLLVLVQQWMTTMVA